MHLLWTKYVTINLSQNNITIIMKQTMHLPNQLWIDQLLLQSSRPAPPTSLLLLAGCASFSMVVHPISYQSQSLRTPLLSPPDVQREQILMCREREQILIAFLIIFDLHIEKLTIATYAMLIHSKSWFRWFPETAENLNFPQKDCLRTRKLSLLKFHHL